MSLKSELRSATRPELFIDCAKRAQKTPNDPNLIVVEQFAVMARAVFKDIDKQTGKVFTAFYEVAHHVAQGTRLLKAFYNAAGYGFAQLPKTDTHHLEFWPLFFEKIAPLLRGDPHLCAIVARDVMQQALPTLAWSTKQTAPKIETASAIIHALGNMPDVVTTLDNTLVRDIVRAHIKADGGVIEAAQRLTKLRSAAPFLDAISHIENEAGVHVVTRPAEVKRNPTDTHKQTGLFTCEFNRASASVAVYDVTFRHDKYHNDLILEHAGDCMKYTDVIADVLFDYASVPLPHQKWVTEIAENTALELSN